jgi:hypothetical protein
MTQPEHLTTIKTHRRLRAAFAWGPDFESRYLQRNENLGAIYHVQLHKEHVTPF